MAQDVLITPASGKIEFKNNTTVSASIVLDAADSNLNLPSGTDVHFQNTTGTAPFIVDSTTKVTNLNADTLDGVSSGSFVRGEGTNNGATTIRVDDADFIVSDSTDGTTNFIWRDHSAGLLYLGTADADVTMRSDVIIQTISSNTDPGADDLLLNGYGMMGSRASNPVYITNFGAGGVQIGSGGVHNASNIAKFTTAETTIQQGNLNVSAGNIILSGTVDGRDIATDGTKLDTIESNATADQTQADINALSITQVGTITTGVWQGSAISTAYISNLSGTNTGDQTQADINALGITQVGTITTGTWQGTAIASAYLDADTAHLSGTQTFTGAKTFSNASGTTFSGSADNTTVKVIKAFDSADEPGALLIATDADTYDDLSFEIRGNTSGGSVDTTTTMASADTTFAVFANGHTTIGYNTLGTTYTAVGTYGLNVSGGVSTTTGYWLGSTQWMDSSRNLSSIGTISSGAITTSGSLTFSGITANAFVGILQETDQNLTLGSTAGAEPRIYLYGSANGQSTAGDIFISPASGGTISLNSTTSISGDLTGVTDIYVDDQIISTGDNNTYMQFHAADQWRVVTGGGERLEITSTNTTVTNNFNVSGTTTLSSQLVADSYILLNKSATADATVTTAVSEALYIRASGWDTNNSVARDVDWIIRNEAISNIYPDMDLAFYEEATSFGHKKFVLHGRGSGSNYQNEKSATFYGSVTILKTLDTAGISGDAAGGTFTVLDGSINLGDGAEDTRLLIKKAQNAVSDHVMFYNGTTRVGEIGCEDDTWLRINQETAKNIYTPRYMRADGGFFVDSTATGIDGSGNFIGGGSVTGGAASFTSIAMGNGNITGVNQLEINDPGEGIIWKAGTSGDITLATIDDASDNILQLSGTGATFRAPVIDIAGQGTFFSDAAGRIATTADFYVQSTSGNTYLYSTNTYLGASSGDNTYLRGNTISGDSWSMTGAGVFTTSGTMSITGADGETALLLSGTSPTIEFRDTNTDLDDFYIHVNSNNFYILADRGGGGTYGAWETPHPLRLEADTNIGYLFDNRMFADNYHPNADKWTTARTITLGGDLTGNVSIDGSANVTLTAAVVDDSHNHIISNVDGLQTALDGKLSTTGTAANSQLLDSLDSTRFSRFSTIYSSATDWDTIFNTSGQYGQVWHEVNNGTTWTNGPGSSAYGYGAIFNYYGSSMKFQWYIPHTASSNNGMWYRTNWGGNSWYDWKRIWDSGNDGSGSGLDADLLDGKQPPTNWAATAQTYTTIASAAWDLPTGSSVFSKADSSGGPGTDGYWFVTGRRDSSGGFSGIYTPHNDGKVYAGYALAGTSNPTWYEVWTSGSDGADSGLDADLLDGQHGSYYLPVPGSQEGATFKKVMSQYNRWGANVDMNGNWDEGVYGGFSTMTNGPSGMNYDPFLVMGSGSDVRTQTVVPRTASRPIAYRGIYSSGSTATAWHYAGWTTTVGDANLSIYAKKSGTDNLVVTKALPKLVLDSSGSGDNWTSQGAQISLGESGDGGSAALHLTYVGDGKGRIGMGTLPATGVPPFGEVKFTYNVDQIQIPSAVLLASEVQSTSDNGIFVKSSSNAVGAPIKFSDHSGGSYAQAGTIEFFHADSVANTLGGTGAYGAGFQITTTETNSVVSVSGDIVATGDIYANSTEALISGNVTGTLFADVIVANKIETDMLKANTITTGKLSANLITTTQLQISNDGTGAGIFMDGANNRIVISDS